MTGRSCERTFPFLAILALLLGGCASWKQQANAGIDRYRKRDALVVINDAAGKPLANTELHIRQTRKAFPFGSAVSREFLRNPQWQEHFVHDFNWAVFENESKWYSNEAAEGRVSYRDADALLAWFDEHRILVRGHCVFWEVEKWQQPWLAALDEAGLRSAVERRLDAVTHFQGRFQTWDVDNEMLHGNFFAGRLGPEIHPWMFQQARQRDPHARLFTNDFNILTVDQNFTEVETQKYVEQIRGLLAAGAPIDGIGVQGHVWAEDLVHHPELVRKRLDLLATLGLPIWISEFDVADPDPRVRADKLEVMYRTAYSHPAVQGIMMWVYWAGNSWRGADAALFNQDWTINAEGERYEALMKEWTTDVTVRTDAQGRCKFRGFFGGYEVTTGDGTRMGAFTLDAGVLPQMLHFMH